MELLPTASLPAPVLEIVEAAKLRMQRMLDDDAPLRDMLAVLTSTAETLASSRTVCSILVLDGEGLLRNGASPNLPADYLDKIDRLKPDANLGTCAAAAATGQVVFTPSFLDDRRWAELRHLPLALGFLGAWSMPIKSADGRVLGTFGTYFREHREPTAQERTIVGALAPMATQAIEARAPVPAACGGGAGPRQEETDADHQGIPSAR
jgi:GAF domain-containing protein